MIDELFNKFSAGRQPAQDDFHAGKMFLLLQDPFGMWCSYHAPKEAAVEEPNLYENLRGKTDRNTRDVWIREHCKTTILVTASNDEERFKRTLSAMAEGVDGIIGGALWDLRGNPGLMGTVNLLFKVNEGQSIFGPYHYKIVQLKRAGEMKEHYAMQTAVMNEILSNIQEYAPQNALFIFKSKEQTLDCARIIERAKNHIKDWQLIKSGELIPDAKKPPKAAMPPWRVFANKYLFEKKDLALLPHLSGQMRDALKAHNLHTYEDVAKAGLPVVKEILQEPLATDAIAIDTYWHSVAFTHGKPVLREKGVFPLVPKQRNLYFDFEATETFTKDSISFIYLIGVWDKEENKFVSFVAKSEAEEEIIFKQFADYIGPAGQSALYHWTEYEVKKMRALCEKYPNIKNDLQKLVDACVDLKIVVERAFYLPAPSLSLKAAAPAFGFNWRQTDCGAMDSMVYFTTWLKTGDEALLKKVLMYNEDDCIAMLYVEDYLKKAEVFIP